MIPVVDVFDFDLLYRGLIFYGNSKRILCITPLSCSYDFLVIYADFSTAILNRYSYAFLGGVV